jgi:tetrahydromethanopterin S-methyltransferase subunit A
MICNIVANPNIRYIVLCGRESSGHLPGDALLALKQNGIDETKCIVGSQALTPYLSNIPKELVGRFNQQIVSIVNLLCKPGEKDTNLPGLNPKVVEDAVRSCYQENPVKFRGYMLHDMGAYPELAIVHKIAAKLSQTQQPVEPGKSKMGLGLVLHKLDLAKAKCHLEDCPSLEQPEFSENRRALAKLLE